MFSILALLENQPIFTSPLSRTDDQIRLSVLKILLYLSIYEIPFKSIIPSTLLINLRWVQDYIDLQTLAVYINLHFFFSEYISLIDKVIEQLGKYKAAANAASTESPFLITF